MRIRPTLAVFEEFDLAQALFGFGFALVGTAEILALSRKALCSLLSLF